jgi:hypothetical protein
MNRSENPTSHDLSTLAGLLSSQVRADVLAYSLTHPDVSFSLTEIARVLDLAISSVQHECYKLQAMGIYRDRRDGASRRYTLQVDDLVVRALRDLVVATLGTPAAVERALRDLPGISAATVLGAIPAREGGTALVLIGDLSLETVELAQRRVAWLLDSPEDAIEIAFFRPADWLARRDAGHPLVRRLLDLPVRVAFGEVRAEDASPREANTP